MRKFFLFSILLAAVTACTGVIPQENIVNQVDPRIGSGGHGHVFVGAGVPFGMVQLGPTSIPQAWDWCSGYHSSDSTVIGFSHTHLSGTGIGDLCDIGVMPVVGEDLVYARGVETDPGSGLWSLADRSREVAVPGYYSVPLLRYGVTAELTATDRVGMHRYTFPASDCAALVFDLENGGNFEAPFDTGLEVLDSCTVRGWRHSSGWARNQKLFFYAKFSKPFRFTAVPGANNPALTGYGRFSFRTEEGEQVLLKVALSPTGVEGAQKAMEAELPGWDFTAVRLAATRRWEQALSSVQIETSDPEVRKIFYTALYHTMIAPSLFCDVDGTYRGADDAVHPDPGYRTATTFSLWDTYRAAMPLYSIILPDRRADFISTMLAIYDEQGKLPVWHLMANETDCMVGNPGVIAVAEAIVKGYPGFDRERAYQACKASVMLDERGQDLRKQYGYIPCDLCPEACARDMEYAIADAAVASAARALGHAEDAAFFRERSHSWRHFFDPATGFVRGRTADGGWRTPFNPFYAPHRANDYCEGNAWQYTWLAPHDLPGLIACFGSREAMLARLDSLFTAPSALGDEASPDMSGLIGQYVHGNEPSHHIVYLYTMAGEPGKTADKVRQILSEQYSAAPDGLSGNEDVGQMSAWYILSALGFYQVEPASTRYWFGSPLVDGASIAVGEGKRFTIKVEGNSPANRYIQEVRLNGKPWDRPYIDFEDIRSGASLTFRMGPEPALWYEWDKSFQ